MLLLFVLVGACEEESIAPQVIGSDPEPFETEVLLRSRAAGGTDEAELPTGSIRAFDKSTGVYLLEWQGFDGRAKSIEYVRPDTVSVVLNTRVTKGTERRYRYSYVVTNLESSVQFLSGFAVQTYAEDVQPVVEPGVYVGSMARYIREFSEGTWYRFGNNVYGADVVPGQSTTIELESDAPPGIVACKVHGGRLGMVGVGEEIPRELEDLLPGYSAWPSGHTIAPNENFGPYGSDQRYDQVREQLDRVVALGWLHEDLAPEYRSALAEERIDTSVLAGTVRRHAREGSASREFADLLIEPVQHP
jgi:hypothetical protein